MDQSVQDGNIPCLPSEVLAHMLQYVALQQRLSNCALVSRAWYTAAVAATTSIDVHLCAAKAPSLEGWLHGNSSKMSSLAVSGQGGFNVGLQLPSQHLQHLQQLSLKDVTLSSGSEPDSSSSPNSPTTPHTLGVLSNLTSLQLEDVTIPSKDYLAPLSALTNLRHLQLVQVQIYELELSDSANKALCAHIGGALAKLTQLTRLALCGAAAHATNDPVVAISCLQQLREFTLAGSELTDASLAHLPPSLTLLNISSTYGLTLNIASTPQLAQLTGLQELTVRGTFHCYVDPGVLSNLVQLQRLALQRCILSGEGAGTAALLDVLPHFTQLQHLDLFNTLDHGAPQAQSYAALVPTTLTHLDLRDCALPAAAVQAMFPAVPGRQLPGLRVLRLGLDEDDDDEFSSWVDVLEERDVRQLVSCCPGLQELWLVGEDGSAVQPGLPALLQLTGLTALAVGGAVVNDEVATQVLAQLTGLQQLRVFGGVHFTEAGLVSLVCLKQLHCLEVDRCGLAVNGGLDFHSNVSEVSPPDVWQQLEAHLKAHFIDSNSCLTAMLNGVQAQLQDTAGGAGVEGLLVSVLLQLAASQQQSAELRQQLAASQQQSTELRQQLAASQQQSAEFRQQVAAQLAAHLAVVEQQLAAAEAAGEGQ